MSDREERNLENLAKIFTKIAAYYKSCSFGCKFEKSLF